MLIIAAVIIIVLIWIFVSNNRIEGYQNIVGSQPAMVLPMQYGQVVKKLDYLKSDDPMITSDHDGFVGCFNKPGFDGHHRIPMGHFVNLGCGKPDVASCRMVMKTLYGKGRFAVDKNGVCRGGPLEEPGWASGGKTDCKDPNALFIYEF